MEKLLVKIQRPVFATEGMPHDILVYNKDRELVLFIYPRQAVYQDILKLMGEEYKKFFYIEGLSFSDVGEGSFKIKEEAPWQDW